MGRWDGSAWWVWCGTVGSSRKDVDATQARQNHGWCPEPTSNRCQAKPPGLPSWRPSYAWPRIRGRRPHRGSTENDSEGRQRSPHRFDTVLTSADSGPSRGRLPLAGSEQLGSNPGRIRAVSSDCLRSPLQPDLAGHNRYGSQKRRSEGCSGIPGVQPDSSAAPYFRSSDALFTR